MIEQLKGMIGGIAATVIGGAILIMVFKPFSKNETPVATAPVAEKEEKPKEETPKEETFEPFSFYSPKLRFFASGPETPEFDDRHYQTRFSKDSLAYLNWELNIKYHKAKKRIPFNVMAVFYRSNGEEFARQTLETYVDKDWEDSFHYWGWGDDKPGVWGKDKYTVELYIRGNMVTKGSFTVY